MKMFTKSLFLITIGLMACFQANAETVITGGAVNGKWTKTNSPYQVYRDISVSEGNKLEIESGVVVVFASNTSLTVRGGELFINGTQGDSVVFTSQTATAEWRGIQIDSYSGDITKVAIEYAVFENAGIYSNGTGIVPLSISIKRCAIKGNTDTYKYAVNISGNNAEIELSDNNIFNNRSGVIISNSKSTKLSNNQIINNLGNGLSLSGANISISNNIIQNNSGCGVYISGGNVELTGNNISNNNNIGSYSKGGGGVYISNGIVKLEKNIITQNTSNRSGGGVHISGGTVDIINNLISNNAAVDNTHNTAYGGGIYISASTSAGQEVVTIVKLLNNNIIDNSANAYEDLYVGSQYSNRIIELELANNQFSKDVLISNVILSGSINNAKFNSIYITNNEGNFTLGNNEIDSVVVAFNVSIQLNNNQIGSLTARNINLSLTTNTFLNSISIDNNDNSIISGEIANSELSNITINSSGNLKLSNSKVSNIVVIKVNFNANNNTIGSLSASGIENLYLGENNKFTSDIHITNTKLSGKIHNSTLNGITLRDNSGIVEISKNTISNVDVDADAISISNSAANIFENVISNNRSGIHITNNSSVNIYNNEINIAVPLKSQNAL